MCPELKEARIGMGMCPGRVWRDWCRDLDTDIQVIQNQQINVVASIITNTELKQMNYYDFYDRIRKLNLESLELSIHDKWLPNSVENFMKVVTSILEHLQNDRTVLVHCNGGRGRTGLVVSACILNLGYPIDQAIHMVRTARTGMLRNPAQEIFLRSLVFKPDSILKLSPRQTIPRINLEFPSFSQSSSTPRLTIPSVSPRQKPVSPRSKPASPRKKPLFSPRSLIQSVWGSPNAEISSEINPSINSAVLDVGASPEIPIDVSFSPILIISKLNDKI
jgi:protein-tyrosine phosphatase